MGRKLRVLKKQGLSPTDSSPAPTLPYAEIVTDGTGKSFLAVRLFVPIEVVPIPVRQDSPVSLPIGVLRGRESEVFSLIRRGMINKEISDALCISERTVKFHNSNIYSKLHLSGRLELLRVYGIVDKEKSE